MKCPLRAEMGDFAFVRALLTGLTWAALESCDQLQWCFRSLSHRERDRRRRAR